MWERVISDVCIFLYMFLWNLNDILKGFKDMGRSPLPWLSYFIFLSPLSFAELLEFLELLV